MRTSNDFIIIKMLMNVQKLGKRNIFNKNNLIQKAFLNIQQLIYQFKIYLRGKLQVNN